jgi:hypothetical protein
MKILQGLRRDSAVLPANIHKKIYREREEEHS